MPVWVGWFSILLVYNERKFSPFPRESMDQGVGLLASETPVVLKADPRLKLLHELEPAYRVFFRNLVDTLTFRPLPTPVTAWPAGGLWRDVFVESPVAWRSFMESMLWHVVTAIAVWVLSGWGPRKPTFPTAQQRAARESHITYYPAARSAPPPESVRQLVREAQKPARRNALSVAREQRRSSGSANAPDVHLANNSRPPNVGAGSAMPSVPLSATSQHLTLPSGWTSVVAPPPNALTHSRMPATPQATVVAPAPDLGDVAARPGVTAPAPAVVAPPPTLQGLMHKIENFFGSSSGSDGKVVPPPPSTQGAGAGNASSGRVGSLPGAGGQVIPPPPSEQAAGNGMGGRMGSRAGGGTQVVPPPPSLQGGSGAGGRLGSLSGNGGQVVPPPPSVGGEGNSPGGHRVGALSGAGSVIAPPPTDLGAGNGSGGRVGALGGSGSQVVPPPPSIAAAGNGNGLGGRFGSPGGEGGQAVGPPPSLQGAGNGMRGKGIGNLPGSGSNVIPPPPTVAGAGNGKGNGMGLSAGGSQVVPPPPSLRGDGAGGGGSGHRLGSIGGNGSQVVPPPPALQAGGAGGNGRGVGSLGGNGNQAVPPPPSMQGSGGGGSGGGGRLSAGLGGAGEVAPPSSGGGSGGGVASGGGSNSLASGGPGGSGSGAPGGAPAGGGSVNTGPLPMMDDLTAENGPQTVPPPPSAQGEDLPLRFISLAIPKEGSSFFSNYEVFIAEKRLSKSKYELIKLVYTFLPYQKRLSDYQAENAKVYTLRVVRDPKCDEPLMQMMWPEAVQDLLDSQGNAASDPNLKLPCYQTTADDYQRAMARGR